MNIVCKLHVCDNKCQKQNKICGSKYKEFYLIAERNRKKALIGWSLESISLQTKTHLNHFSVINILILNFHENCVHI